MALVSFTLSEEGVGAFNDALMCVNKFSDDVSLEVRKDQVRISGQEIEWLTWPPTDLRLS